jgi:hypothetical protein
MLELHCIICTALLPEPRAIRGGRTCGKECQREAHRRLRQRCSQIRCRLCGRPNPRRTQIDAVRTAHSAPGVMATFAPKVLHHTTQLDNRCLMQETKKAHPHAG